MSETREVDGASSVQRYMRGIEARQAREEAAEKLARLVLDATRDHYDPLVTGAMRAEAKRVLGEEE